MIIMLILFAWSSNSLRQTHWDTANRFKIESLCSGFNHLAGITIKQDHI